MGWAVTLGFSGTGDADMAPRQLKQVRQLIGYVLRPTVMHFGDCVHADAQAFVIAKEFGVKTIGHPPDNSRKRAFCEYDEERPPRPYLLRNDDIAREGVDGLIAAPEGWVEVTRSGTWATVRYARKFKRHIWIVRPDGSVQEEQ